jgi:hypothetical protein
MRDDPFARLGALDQQLFAQPKAKTAPAEGRKSVRPDEPAPEQRAGRTSIAKKERLLAETFPGPCERPTERRPYDFYSDQLLWLDRTKVELHERYRRRITSNAIVQLALELLIRDYRARGRHSRVITHLVFGQPLEESTADEGTSGQPDGEG